MNPRPAQTFNTRTWQRAFTLLEAVLAVLIVTSLGVGIAALYARSDNVARGGRLHRDAVVLVGNMAQQIRERGNTKGNFETHLGQTCESTRNANNDIAHAVACWQEAVSTRLTNGSSRIVLDATVTPATYAVEVSWSEPRTGTASYVLRVPVTAQQ